MEAADETRKHGASLLTQAGPLNNAALGAWLGFAAKALGAASPADESSGDPSGDADTQSPSADPVDWAASLGPMFTAWTEALDKMQGSGQPWFPMPAENPIARLLSHPAAVVGNDHSTSRLAAQAGLAMIDFVQVAMSHQALQAQGWMKALQRFAADFQGGADSGSKPVLMTSLDDLVTHWGTIGEAVLQEHSRSEPFLRSQAAMMRKAMNFRVAQRHVMEATLRSNDLPTLADLDEAFASIHALKSEVRELRKLARLSAPAATPAPSPPRAKAETKPKAKAKAAPAKRSNRQRKAA